MMLMQHWDLLLLQGGGVMKRTTKPAASAALRVKPDRLAAAATRYTRVGTPSARDVVLGAVDCAKADATKPGVKLGCGEQGCTYQLTADTVLKITQWKTKPTPRVWRAWEEEGLIGQELGALGIAPRVYEAFKCKDAGYIVMDMLTPLSKELPGVLAKDALGSVVDIRRFPEEQQRGYAQVLSRMGANGFVHMDNHLGNLGFFAGTRKPLVFDFGFTQRRSLTKTDQLWALALALFIMLEHVKDVAALEQSVLCHDALAALREATTAAAPLQLKALRKLLFPGGDGVDAAVAAARRLSSSSSPNADIYVACLAFLVLLQLPREKRYTHALYNTVYQVRTGKFKI